MALRLPLRIALASTLALLLLPSLARAHWCDDLWDSSYNIVVKPASDTVTVPSTGSATLDLYVQNNMGYPLKNFRFSATPVDGTYQISSVSTAPKVANYLMPGETIKYTLTISKSGGATLDVASRLVFHVNFGDSTSSIQDDYYSGEKSSQSGGHPVMVKKFSGGLYPASITALNSTNNEQGYYLQNSVNADYLGTPDTGLDGMLGEMLGETDCLVASPDDYDYLDIWAAIGLAVRKSVLGDTRANSLRTQLQCGWDNAHPTYKALAAVVLGYLDHDATTPNSGVVTFFTNIINDSGSSADDKALAKVGLFLGDGSSYRTDVAGIPASSSLSAQTQMAAAAALGIVDGNDSVVENELIARADWKEPAISGEEGRGLLASHLLDLVAWDRRGWKQYACDTGAVSFYAENAPEGTCGGGGGGGGGGGASGGCGFGAGGGASLLAILLIFAARRRKT